MDYLIIGQGIAGSLLANSLLKRGKQILVIDNCHKSCSSNVAAGLYNPIVFKRFVESWMVRELLPSADKIYAELEEELKVQFYFRKNIYKIFSSEEEKYLWYKKAVESPFMSKEELPFENDSVEHLNGGGFVVDSGYLDVAFFLSVYRTFLKYNELLNEAYFDYNDLAFSDEYVLWKGVKAHQIIFCEGSSCIKNPFFSWLPFKLTKGEVLTVKIPELTDQYVINKGVFILPVGNDIFKVGATYEWQDLSEQTTEKGRSELLEKLNKILKVPYEIIEHKAGVRPTVSDRRPLIGMHPEHKNVGVFNGMGTKGVMIAPYFAEHFADYLDGKIALNGEVDVERYKSFYKSIR